MFWCSITEITSIQVICAVKSFSSWDLCKNFETLVESSQNTISSLYVFISIEYFSLLTWIVRLSVRVTGEALSEYSVIVAVNVTTTVATGWFILIIRRLRLVSAEPSRLSVTTTEEEAPVLTFREPVNCEENQYLYISSQLSLSNIFTDWQM